MRDQVAPGTEIPTSRRNADSRLFLQDPTGCYVLTPSPAASPTAFPADRRPEGRRAGRTHVENRCRFRLASVSASEHPGSSFENRGLLSVFQRKVAP